MNSIVRPRRFRGARTRACRADTRVDAWRHALWGRRFRRRFRLPPLWDKPPGLSGVCDTEVDEKEPNRSRDRKGGVLGVALNLNAPFRRRAACATPPLTFTTS